MKTWDVLDRETGCFEFSTNTAVLGPQRWLATHEVAWCRETGEVVYR